MSELKVFVVAFGDRGVYQLRWKDPLSGRTKTRSTGIKITGKQKDHAEAVKKAAALEALLRQNYTAANKAMTWQAFRERYEREVGTGKAANTLVKVVGTFNVVERHLNPQRIIDLTEERIGFLTSELRLLKRSEATIKSTLAHLKAALRWAKRMKLVAFVPEIEMPTRAADKSKGRPITGEEFDRMIAAIPAALKDTEHAEHAQEWERLLRGLYLSGLRLGEALALSWDNENGLRIDLSGKRPMLNIPAGCDKSGKARLLALTPDFAELLLATPEGERTGLVFRVHVARRTAIRIVTSFGKKANVKVAGDGDKVKFASAHDLRRSFGERWAQRLLPQVLMELMRHSDMSTTLRYYTGTNANRTADAVYEAFAKSHIQSNIGPATHPENNHASKA